MAARTNKIAVDDACCSSALVAPISEAQAAQMAKRFAALGDPVRFRLLSMIAAAGEVCACDLTGPLGKSQPTVSHHTTLLAEAGLIEGEKRGRWVWWRIVPEQLDVLRRNLLLPSPASS